MTMWTSECSRYEHQLALWVGGDLDARSQCECRRHLDVCSVCAERYQQLKAAAGALADVASATRTRPAADSLWPALRRQLHAPRTRLTEPSETPAWLSFSAVAAACFALAIVALEQPVRMADQRESDVQVQPVRGPVWNLSGDFEPGPQRGDLNRKPSPLPLDLRLPASPERSSGY